MHFPTNESAAVSYDVTNAAAAAASGFVAPQVKYEKEALKWKNCKKKAGGAQGTEMTSVHGNADAHCL